ncbi:ribosome maturation factor RimP [Umezawaea endophytica]|uniref:Ribosome maturation factor RimP n=1 Tax=Umezawaea endophytica TaxID=1654476 RepID=A0A9X3A5V8_9PSEU|nr:ribosome maturation factor RimP [Umezawaea endophytica]MCS7482698.1 ribosome maturation factor RimP [Umezawaea endophytica]
MSSPPRGDLAAQLEPVVQEAVAAIGFDLELLDVHQAGRRRLVKVVVDAEHGIGLDEVAQASRAVAAALDEVDHLMAGPYTLEVTSPGADRPLTKPRHWRRAKLRLVKVKQPDSVEWFGRVGQSDDDGVVLLVKGELRRVEYRTIERAVVEIEFKPAPVAELSLLEPGQHDGGSDDTANDPAGPTTPKEESR